MTRYLDSAMIKPNLYRVTDAAKKIGLSRQRLWLYINDGRCASVDIEGVCMVTAKEIERFRKALLRGTLPIVSRNGDKPKSGQKGKSKR